MTPSERAFLNRDVSLLDLQEEADRIYDAFELDTVIGNGGKDIHCERQLTLHISAREELNYRRR